LKLKESEYVKKQREKGRKRLEGIFKERLDYEMLSEYKSNKQRIEIKHLKCGRIFNVTVRAVILGKGICPYCWKNPRAVRAGEKFYKFVESVPDYEVLTEYINSKEKVVFKHLKCGREYKASPNMFISHGNRCPHCTISLGEEDVKIFLDKNNIRYKREKLFNDMKSISYLRFDFYLLDLEIAIEYSGKQHYEPIEFFGGEKEFKNIQRRDAAKRKYCADNNIPFIEIPYNEKDIETYLNNQLNLYRNNK